MMRYPTNIGSLTEGIHLIEHITMCEHDRASVKERWFLVCMHSQLELCDVMLAQP
jgi:hypothetical protein